MIPFVHDAVLDMHMAFNNPQWSEFLDEEVLVIFTGPHAYISPRWYEDKWTLCGYCKIRRTYRKR
jgi:transcriptional regulator